MIPYSEVLRSALPSSRTVEHQPLDNPATRSSAKAIGSSSFSQILQKKMAPADVVFSGHASERLRLRGIAQSPHLVQSLKTAVDQLAQKGARDSLVVVDDVGFVVNVPNRTVVTALSMATDHSQVFTNIDSAIWVKATSKQ
ncbi:MAG: flagellar protein [Firmicutes bacterium]|nr:flagellar protein [Bacillota bacterium]